ncbi:hypothetical protein JG687_00017964 [Phytophthora cactorum]|uniref:Uncharacterized protein n=1 Tax=Phytophthora cactorum TaxID=29920 RepID=A0A8T1TLZ7_9STRA|nr:hypothetical protein JG687_00017964 [Phytophthora cactorum]
MLRQCELDHSQIIIPRSSTQDTLSLNCTSKGERLSVPGDITWLLCANQSSEK